ncbi:MAG: AAA family ATPase, partial [Bacteroidales bacterium]|nr:AAA family ATPase [Bacteroidales bacterium]
RSSDLTNGHYLLYAVEIGLQSVSESLFLSGIGKSNDRTVFKRKDTEIKAKFIPNSDSAKKLLEMNNRSSLLPLNQKFPVLPDEEVREAFKWFMEKLVIITVNSTVPALIDIMSHNPELLSFTNELFEKTGVGIQSFKISDTPLDEWMSNHQNFKDIQQIIEQDPLKPDTSISRMENNRNIFAVSLKQGIKTVQEFIFDQMGQDGFHKGMKITAQSDGTVRLLTLIPAIYEAIRHEKVIFVDEIDNSIHPNLLISLLQYFGSTKSKGQLIYTTHTTKLINQQELLRPDEIWLIEKKQGNSKLYSINDFKIHNTINLENGYLDGRYGGIPQMGDFFE